MFKKIVSGLFILLATALFLELLLRIYNPFEFSVRGDKIILNTNETKITKNKNIPNIDSVLMYKKNSLGFRGPEPPENFEEALTFITVGASTTECAYITEGKTWPDLLLKKLQKQHPDKTVWGNNAGANGYSSYGMTVLLEDYLVQLKPDYLFFLLGGCDVGAKHLNEADQRLFKEKENKNLGLILLNLANYSELISTIMNLKRLAETQHIPINLKDEIKLNELEEIELSESWKKETLAKHQKLLPNYEKRLEKIIEICEKNDIKPIFMSQQAVYGKGIDPYSKANLEKIKIYENINGELEWAILESYNKITRKVAQAKNIAFIDLANEFPKDSRYFVDFVHFNNLGCELAAEIVFEGFDGKGRN